MHKIKSIEEGITDMSEWLLFDEYIPIQLPESKYFCTHLFANKYAYNINIVVLV